MIAVTTTDGLVHTLDSVESIAAIDSPNTRAALQAAYDAGDWEPYTPPELAPAPPEPNWQSFRLKLMISPSFRAWAATLPADWREDLKSCAILCNTDALQTTYTYLASIYPPEPEAATEWQQIATENHIPVTFRDAQANALL